MLDGSPKDEATVREAFAGMEEMFELIASGLYTLASMLVGEGEESVQLVETAVATADVSACEDATQARKSSRLALSKAALEVLVSRDPDGLAAPKHLEPARGCIEDDDLDAAGLASEELAKMMAGPDRDRLRTWLASLSTEARVIFVMRAVAGFSSPEVAALLAAHGGPRSAGWNADAVREIFRQALCSLASQLLHALTSR
jgi:DNA-directed RNA polymerase specialized sigma24 family protein